MIHTCLVCGKEFEADRLRRVTCGSVECRRKRLSETSRAYYTVNREQAAATDKTYYEKNRERIRTKEEAGRKLRKEWRNSWGAKADDPL
jgi:hypothetical protein